MFTTKYDQIKPCKKCKLRTTRSILELNFLSFFSGTTWVQEIVWQILNDGKISEERVESRYPFLEKSQLFDRPGDESDGQNVSVTSRPSPRLIKSHLPYHVIPMSKEESKRSKYIYVARNPKDVAVSFYHFIQSFDAGSYFNGTWEFFVKLFLEGKSKDFLFVKYGFCCELSGSLTALGARLLLYLQVRHLRKNNLAPTFTSLDQFVPKSFKAIMISTAKEYVLP